MQFPAVPPTILQQISSLVQIVIGKALPHDQYLKWEWASGLQGEEKEHS